MRERLTEAVRSKLDASGYSVEGGIDVSLVDAILAELREPDAETIEQGFWATPKHVQSVDCLIAFFSMIDHVRAGK